MYTADHTESVEADPASRKASARLLRDAAYRELRRLVLTGEFPFGHRMGEESVAERLGVSRTPAREAMLRLHADRLLNQYADGGFYVAEPDLIDLRDLYELRLALEVHAILRAQLKETRPSAREASGDESIPVALDQLVERLLSFRPEERPAEAREVRDQLRGIARQRGGAAPSAPKTLATAEALRSGWVLLVVMLAAGGALGGVLALAPLSSSDTGDKAERSAAASGLPAELEPALRALASGSAKARRTAADQLLHASEGAVPAYATQLARLELARSCKEKKPVLEALLALGDERAGPSLARLASEPERGCGPREKQDCLGCLRELLARATVPR